VTFLLSIQAFLGLRLPQSILFFLPDDQPTFNGGKEMGNETFYWDSLYKVQRTCDENAAEAKMALVSCLNWKAFFDFKAKIY